MQITSASDPSVAGGHWRWEVGLGNTFLQPEGSISLRFLLLQVSRWDSTESGGESLSEATTLFLLENQMFLRKS